MPAFKIIVKDSITKELWEMKHHPTTHLCTLVYAQSLNIAAVWAPNTVERTGHRMAKDFQRYQKPKPEYQFDSKKESRTQAHQNSVQEATENKCMQMTHKLRMHSQLHKINFISIMIFL
jgi:hypothetical protein